MIYTLPFIAAIIGWFTNYLAVKMLFYPRKKVKVLFLEFQGIFPKKQRILAERIGKLVAEELLSVKDLQEIMNNPENVNGINKNIEDRIEDYLINTFPEKYPMLSYFIGDKSREKIQRAMMIELETMGPQVMNQAIENLESTLDIEAFVKERVSMYSTERIEQLIQGILSSEFKFIERVGALVGFLVGLVQVAIITISG
ncbi:MAG TPA: DUF445 family protein [Flavobacteriales bacterium]|nr:DUF445 family protein [Flavobacteriales bacterium]HIN39034.1 DUF445 family protein [Flavobacteriales bacterium]